MSSSSFTKSLLSCPDIAELYERATRTEFLALAGRGRVPRELLSQWLAQDRLYCLAYARFVGGLISRVRLPQDLKQGGEEAAGRATAETLEWRILALLRGALAGVMEELPLFERTAAAYGLDLRTLGSEMEGQAVAFCASRTTRDYVDLFDSFAALPGARTDKPLLEGLLVLWLTEKTYLDAWSYAKQQQQQQQPHQDPAEDLDGGALREHLIGNWTSDAFKAFVGEIEACLDALAAAQVRDTEEVLISSSLSVVKKILVLEEAFWPLVA